MKNAMANKDSFRDKRKKAILSSLLAELSIVEKKFEKLYLDNNHHREVFLEIIENEIKLKLESLAFAQSANRRSMVSELQTDIEILNEYHPDGKTQIQSEPISGSSFIINKEGHLITNAHVVGDYKEMKVTLRGEDYTAKVIALDNVNDLALLKSDLTNLKYFKLSNTDVERMEEITAIGFGFGKRFSSDVKATRGIVSSLAGLANNYSQFQTDAAIQVGNSGGPILNNKSEVVGVAVAKLNSEVAYKESGTIAENVNFAIKISTLKQFLDAHNINYDVGDGLDKDLKTRNSIIDDSALFIFNEGKD